jgi:hypothetical protein
MSTNTDLKSAAAESLCPCGKASRAELERISRGFLVKTLLFWLPLKRYKCYRCRRKKLVFG